MPRSNSPNRLFVDTVPFTCAAVSLVKSPSSSWKLPFTSARSSVPPSTPTTTAVAPLVPPLMRSPASKAPMKTLSNPSCCTLPTTGALSTGLWAASSLLNSSSSVTVAPPFNDAVTFAIRLPSKVVSTPTMPNRPWPGTPAAGIVSSDRPSMRITASRTKKRLSSRVSPMAPPSIRSGLPVCPALAEPCSLFRKKPRLRSDLVPPLRSSAEAPFTESTRNRPVPAVLSSSRKPVCAAFRSALTAPPVCALIAASTCWTVLPPRLSSTILCWKPVRSVMMKSTLFEAAPGAKPSSFCATAFAVSIVK